MIQMKTCAIIIIIIIVVVVIVVFSYDVVDYGGDHNNEYGGCDDRDSFPRPFSVAVTNVAKRNYRWSMRTGFSGTGEVDLSTGLRMRRWRPREAGPSPATAEAT